MKGQIHVHRKGFTRKDGTYVPPTDYLTKDKGAPGKTPPSKQWAQFKTHTGWSKHDSAAIRRKHLYSATVPSLSRHEKLIQAGRFAQELANVTTDPETKKLANEDAHYFFNKAKEMELKP
ncbi:MAG: hypothetical protein MUO73_01505 [Thermoplasmata archaeon]|nr:hypothetical protein [Thermoplasmata archaeon]